MNPAQSRLFLTDALNSVIAQMNDDATASLANSHAYSPYGQSEVIGVDTTSNPIQYTSRENDNTGLMYYRARFYDPVLKRFISEDPIGLQGGMNVFGYVEGDPVSKSDPTGLLSADATVNVQAQASVMLVMLGGSAAIGQNISTDGNSCTYVQVCPRLGFGLFARAGIGVGGGIGGAGSSPGMSIGGGYDAGFGLTQGAQMTVGPDGVSASGGRVGLGVGAGFSAGVDACIQIPIRCEQVFCPR